MNLSLYTDYSLRVVVYLGVHSSGLATITDISEAYGISRNHLVKVVNHLGKCGVIKTQRGRAGGLQLARDPAGISIGELVRDTESSFRMCECFDLNHSACQLTPACQLKTVFAEAKNAFLAVLDQHSLADVLKRRRKMAALLGVSANKATDRRGTSVPA